MSKASEKMSEEIEAIKTLGRMGVKPGADVYTMVTHVSSSGMTRHIRCYIPTMNVSIDYKTGKKTRKAGITDITGLVATACGFRRDKGSRWDIVVQGCGMDMCFHVVYTLGRAMFPNGGPLDKSPRERQERSAGEKIERDGGYLLNKKSL